MHKDVISEMYKFQINELLEKSQKGEEISIELLVETLLLGIRSTHESFVHIAGTCEEYADIILRMKKEMSRERRIVQLFLDNHGLGREYDNFEARILERIFIK